jgi:hypothetical protein
VINDDNVICNNPTVRSCRSYERCKELISVPLLVLQFNVMSRKLPCRSRDSIGGIETGLRAGRFGVRPPAVICLLKPFKSVMGVNFTTHRHAVPMFRMGGAIPLIPYMPTRRGQEKL